VGKKERQPLVGSSKFLFPMWVFPHYERIYSALWQMGATFNDSSVPIWQEEVL
jgi:hypothetical protein